MKPRQAECKRGHRTIEDKDMYITTNRKGQIRLRCRLCQLQAAHTYYRKHFKHKTKRRIDGSSQLRSPEGKTMNMQPKINTIRAWIQRRTDKGEHPNADEIYKRIKHNWPTLSEVDMETVFQGCPK